MFFIGNKQIKPSFANSGSSSDVETVSAKNLSGNVINKGDKVWVNNYGFGVVSLQSLNEFIDSSIGYTSMLPNGNAICIRELYNNVFHKYHATWNNDYTITLAKDSEIPTFDYPESCVIYNGLAFNNDLTDCFNNTITGASDSYALNTTFSYDKSVVCSSGNQGWGCAIYKVNTNTLVADTANAIDLSVSSSSAPCWEKLWKINDDIYYGIYGNEYPFSKHLVTADWVNREVTSIKNLSSSDDYTIIDRNLALKSVNISGGSVYKIYYFDTETLSFNELNIPALTEFNNKIHYATPYYIYNASCNTIIFYGVDGCDTCIIKIDPITHEVKVINLNLNKIIGLEQNTCRYAMISNNGSKLLLYLTYNNGSDDSKIEPVLIRISEINGYGIVSDKCSLLSDSSYNGLSNAIISNNSLGEVSIIKEETE